MNTDKRSREYPIRLAEQDTSSYQSIDEIRVFAEQQLAPPPLPSRPRFHPQRDGDSDKTGLNVFTATSCLVGASWMHAHFIFETWRYLMARPFQLTSNHEASLRQLLMVNGIGFAATLFINTITYTPLIVEIYQRKFPSMKYKNKLHLTISEIETIFYAALSMFMAGELANLTTGVTPREYANIAIFFTVFLTLFSGIFSGIGLTLKNISQHEFELDVYRPSYMYDPDRFDKVAHYCRTTAQRLARTFFHEIVEQPGAWSKFKNIYLRYGLLAHDALFGFYVADTMKRQIYPEGATFVMSLAFNLPCLFLGLVNGAVRTIYTYRDCNTTYEAKWYSRAALAPARMLLTLPAMVALANRVYQWTTDEFLYNLLNSFILAGAGILLMPANCHAFSLPMIRTFDASMTALIDTLSARQTNLYSTPTNCCGRFKHWLPCWRQEQVPELSEDNPLVSSASFSLKPSPSSP